MKGADMRLIVASALLLAGCASSEAYVAGTPAPWEQCARVPPPLPPGTMAGAPSGQAVPSVPQPAPPTIVSYRSSGGIVDWFKSGRGWTWGAASRGPARDLALDRMMVDTLTSGSPGYGQEPVATSHGPTKDSWVYPEVSDGVRSGNR